MSECAFLATFTYPSSLAEGAAAINGSRTVNKLVKFLDSDDAEVQGSSADCLAQLAKRGLQLIPLNQTGLTNTNSDHQAPSNAATIIETVIPKLAEMLKSNSTRVIFSAVYCLSQMVNFKDCKPP